MPQPVLHEKQGFTLIEMSIVLVIIGLIVGGILVGRDLIKTAEIRNTIKQFEQFNTAVNTFLGKYRCLPGDCLQGDSFGFDATANGDGNGKISPIGNNAPFDYKEYYNFWYYLSTSSLIGYRFAPYNASTTSIYAGVSSPQAKITGRLGNTTGGWAIQAAVIFNGGNRGNKPPHNFALGNLIHSGFVTSHGHYSAADIYAIDQKIDDGLPFLGSVRAWTSGVISVTISDGALFDSDADVGHGGPDNPVCVRNDTNPIQYNILYTGSQESGLCGLVLKAMF